jgi:hypothetical protein
MYFVAIKMASRTKLPVGRRLRPSRGSKPGLARTVALPPIFIATLRAGASWPFYVPEPRDSLDPYHQEMDISVRWVIWVFIRASKNPPRGHTANSQDLQHECASHSDCV